MDSKFWHNPLRSVDNQAIMYIVDVEHHDIKTDCENSCKTIYRTSTVTDVDVSLEVPEGV